MLRSLCLSAALCFASAASFADTPVRLVEVSRLVFDAGVEARDPLLVAAAAKLRRGLGLTETDRTATDGEAGTDSLDAATMLETAKELAAGDPTMLSLIDDIEAEGSRGVSGGPVYNVARITGGKTDRYASVPFDGGAYAEVYIEARDSSDLNLMIFDDQNRLVCSDTDPSAIGYCGWQPRSDGAFTIAVENKTGGTVTYNLITN